MHALEKEMATHEEGGKLILKGVLYTDMESRLVDAGGEETVGCTERGAWKHTHQKMHNS